MAKPIVNQRDIVILQRDPNNAVYEEIHISGSDLIFYSNATGDLTADKIADFMAIWLSALTAVASSSWSSQSLSSFYSSASKWTDSASWASHSFTSVSSSWASQSFASVSSSWASASSVAFAATSASWASASYNAYY